VVYAASGLFEGTGVIADHLPGGKDVAIHARLPKQGRRRAQHAFRTGRAQFVQRV
jgi:hypothetical protein